MPKSLTIGPICLKIQKNIKSCVNCQTKKTPKKKLAGLLQPIKIGKPMDHIGIDFMGPFARMAKGNTYVTLASDYTAKWVEAKVATGATAIEAVYFIVQQITCKHGFSKGNNECQRVSFQVQASHRNIKGPGNKE